MGQARLKVEGHLAGRWHDSRGRLDPALELFDQEFQARLPDVAQLVEHFPELLEAFLPLFMLLYLLDLEVLDLLRDPRKLGVDSAGETVDVWHDPTSSVYEGKKGRNKNALRLLLVRKQRAAWAPGLVATVFNGR